MRTPLLVLLSVVALIGCSRPAEEKPTDWTTLALAGKTLELIDDKEIESYRFGGQGIVLATLGIKNEAVTAPALYWKIAEGCLVLSEEAEGQSFDKLCSPTIQGDVVSAKRKDGSKVRYRLD